MGLKRRVPLPHHTAAAKLRPSPEVDPESGDTRRVPRYRVLTTIRSTCRCRRVKFDLNDRCHENAIPAKRREDCFGSRMPEAGVACDDRSTFMAPSILPCTYWNALPEDAKQ